MWTYFDTIHINQYPTYTSKYPPAQGAILALGQVLGDPWIGVLLSVALMCGMLQAWFPPKWAFLGGVLALLRFGISSYWINSYWGGAIAAIGGALAVGAIPRIIRFRRPRDAFLLGLGAAILANSRPFEGLVFCLTVGIAVLAWLCSRRSPTWRETAPRIVLPALAILTSTLVFMGYYNWRCTGHPLLFPYLNNRTYTTAPELVWEQQKPPHHYLNPQLDSFYNGWSRETAVAGQANSLPSACRVFYSDAKTFNRFFLWPEFCVPLLTLPWIIRDRRVRFLVFQFFFCFFGFLLVVWFHPHYAAPLTATTVGLVVQGLRHLRRWRTLGRPIGIGISRAVVLATVLLTAVHALECKPKLAIEERANFISQLSALPGDELVVVHYSPDGQGWVYNQADIDHAKVVWAQEIPGLPLQPLLDYFHGREIWLLEPGNPSPELLPYNSSAIH
jgi:hypothetical protein